MECVWTVTVECVTGPFVERNGWGGRHPRWFHPCFIDFLKGGRVMPIYRAHVWTGLCSILRVWAGLTTAASNPKHTHPHPPKHCVLSISHEPKRNVWLSLCLRSFSFSLSHSFCYFFPHFSFPSFFRLDLIHTLLRQLCPTMPFNLFTLVIKWVRRPVSLPQSAPYIFRAHLKCRHDGIINFIHTTSRKFRDTWLELLTWSLKA